MIRPHRHHSERLAPRPTAARGFTLIELLVVIAIIAILAALVFPVYSKMSLAGKQTKTVNRIRDLQRANIQYANDHDGTYVPLSAKDTKDTSGSVPKDSDGKSYNVPWFTNYDFLKYFVGNPGLYWWGNPPEAFDSALYQRVRFAPNSPAATFGYNGENLPLVSYDPPIYWPPGNRRTVTVQNPSKLLAFAESQSDTLYMAKAGDYDAALPDEYRAGVTAYRYNDQTNIVFFDGHVEQFKKEDVVNNTMLWKGQ